MRNKACGYGIILSISAILGIAVVMLGCGNSSSTMGMNLTPAQAQSIATSVSNGVAQAVTSAFATAHVRPGGNIVRDQVSVGPTLPICTPTGTGEVCTWTISNTYSCGGGGNIGVSGMITGTLTNLGSGLAQAQIAANPANCSVNGLVLNGDPQVNLAAQVNVLNNNPVWPVTGTETGGVKYGPNPAGSCQLNLKFTVNSTTSCTVTGTACGQSVSGNC